MDVLLLKEYIELLIIEFLASESMKDPKVPSSLVLPSSFCEDENMLSLPPAALLRPKLWVNTVFLPQSSDRLQ